MPEVIVSDIGSFPKSQSLQSKSGSTGSAAGMKAVVSDIMAWKVKSGLDVPLYPQTRDMIGMFFEPIEKNREWVVPEKEANIAELKFVEQFAKERFEKTGEKLSLGVCITGPVEIYAAKAGYIFDEGLLLNLAKSVNSFCKNAIIKKKWCETTLVSLDEPSLGVNPQLQYEREDIIKALETSFSGIKCMRQIHLHAASENELIYRTKNIDVIGVEAAESPRNLLLYDKKDLSKYDKSIRVGISRSNVFAIESEAKKEISAAVVNKSESVTKIRERYRAAQKQFGDRLLVVGPDCGLGGWKDQNAAYQLLLNTVKAVRG